MFRRKASVMMPLGISQKSNWFCLTVSSHKWRRKSIYAYTGARTHTHLGHLLNQRQDMNRITKISAKITKILDYAKHSLFRHCGSVDLFTVQRHETHGIEPSVNLYRSRFANSILRALWSTLVLTLLQGKSILATTQWTQRYFCKWKEHKTSSDYEDYGLCNMQARAG